jgi:MipA family protein
MTNPYKMIFIGLSMFVIIYTSAYAESPNSPKPDVENTPSPQSEVKMGPDQQDDDKDWKFEVSAGAMYGTKYDGSDNYEVQAFPDISVEYKNGLFFASVFGGIGSYFLQRENYKVGASIGLSMGRNEDDDRENLRGMGDIDMGATANLMGEYSFGPVQISGEISKGTSDYGTTAKFEVGAMFPVTDPLMVMISIGTTWADNTHMQSYFGVSSVQSARSGYNIYNIESGFKSVGLNVGAFYSLTKHWDLGLMAGVDRLLGDAVDSPITKKGLCPNTFLSLSYKF